MAGNGAACVKVEENAKDLIYAPVAGQAVDITEGPDPVFAEGLLGKGVAIQPADGKVLAPVEGTLTTMFETGHAIIGRVQAVGH